MRNVGSRFCRGVMAFALCCGGASGLTAPANAQKDAPPAAVAPAARKAVALQVSFTKGMVTVEENESAFLFGQVVTTPTIKVEVTFSGQSRSGTMTLRDGKDKKLWSGKLGDGRPAEMALKWGMSENPSVKSGLTIKVTPSEKTEKTTSEDSGDLRLTALYGNDNKLVSGDMLMGTKRFHIGWKGDALLMTQYEDGQKTGETVMAMKEGKFSVHHDGKEIAAAKFDDDGGDIKDSLGTVAVRKITKDGKKYTSIRIGDRNILLEGESYEISTNGTDIVIGLPAPETSVSAK